MNIFNSKLTNKFFLIIFGLSNSINFSFINININDNKCKSGFVYQYSIDEIVEQTKESVLYHKFYNNSRYNHYQGFITNTRKILQKPSTNFAKQTFDNLYDNHSTGNIWNNFNELHYTLTTKKLSDQVTLDLNWIKLYQKVNTSTNELKKLQELQLRFYNIIAKVFGYENVLHLAQRIEIDQNMTYISKTTYYPEILAVDFSFNKNFSDETLINNSYARNFISTNSLIISSLHEYAQSLIYYAYNNAKQRKEFNIRSIYNSLNSYRDINKQMKKPLFNFQDAKLFSDVTESLIWILDNSSGIDSNDDPIKKLLIPLLVVGSSEARMAWIADNVNLRYCLFTEAFAKWLGTPSQNRDYSWQLLNAYFIRFFPQFYQF